MDLSKKNIFPYVLIILINGEGQKFTLGEKGKRQGEINNETYK